MARGRPPHPGVGRPRKIRWGIRGPRRAPADSKYHYLQQYLLAYDGTTLKEVPVDTIASIDRRTGEPTASDRVDDYRKLCDRPQRGLRLSADYFFALLQESWTGQRKGFKLFELTQPKPAGGGMELVGIVMTSYWYFVSDPSLPGGSSSFSDAQLQLLYGRNRVMELMIVCNKRAEGWKSLLTSFVLADEVYGAQAIALEAGGATPRALANLYRRKFGFRGVRAVTNAARGATGRSHAYRAGNPVGATLVMRTGGRINYISWISLKKLLYENITKPHQRTRALQPGACSSKPKPGVRKGTAFECWKRRQLRYHGTFPLADARVRQLAQR